MFKIRTLVVLVTLIYINEHVDATQYVGSISKWILLYPYINCTMYLTVFCRKLIRHAILTIQWIHRWMERPWTTRKYRMTAFTSVHSEVMSWRASKEANAFAAMFCQLTTPRWITVSADVIAVVTSASTVAVTRDWGCSICRMLCYRRSSTLAILTTWDAGRTRRMLVIWMALACTLSRWRWTSASISVIRMVTIMPAYRINPTATVTIATERIRRWAVNNVSVSAPVIRLSIVVVQEWIEFSCWHKLDIHCQLVVSILFSLTLFTNLI